MRWLIILFLMFFYSSLSFAQVIKADIGVNGLTCSQCSRSVYNRITKLPFVQEVEMDLNETIAHVTFKKGARVSFEELAESVRKAGYSVRDMKFEMRLDDAYDIKENILCFEGSCISFDKKPDKKEGSLRFILLGDGFNADRKQNATAVKIKERGKEINYYNATMVE